MNYWLMKSEPHEFSIDDLMRKKRHHWDGVRNYEARNIMRDRMKVGDLVIFYHSDGDPSGPAGVAKVSREAYPDFTQWKRSSKYFDPRGTKRDPLWFMVDVAFVKKFKNVIERDLLREVPALRNMPLWKRPRLSITPLAKKEFETIVKLGTK